MQSTSKGKDQGGQGGWVGTNNRTARWLHLPHRRSYNNDVDLCHCNALSTCRVGEQLRELAVQARRGREVQATNRGPVASFADHFRGTGATCDRSCTPSWDFTSAVDKAGAEMPSLATPHRRCTFSGSLQAGASGTSQHCSVPLDQEGGLAPQLTLQHRDFHRRSGRNLGLWCAGQKSPTGSRKRGEGR